MKVFYRVWLGQLASLMGSAMTAFALGVWIYQETHSAALFSTLAIFTILPNLVFAPLAGVVADRWSRRQVMIVADSACAALSLLLAALLASGRLQFWHVCAINLASASLTLFHRTAYSASVATLVEEKQLGRANGLMQIAHASSQLLAPMLAGALLGLVDITGVVVIDLATFAFGVTTLYTVSFPKLESRTMRQRTFKQDLLQGWRYLRSQRGLVGLVIFSALINTLLSSAGVLLGPMILSFTTPAALGGVMTAAGLGMLAGGVLLAVWRGPRSPVVGVVAFSIVTAFWVTLAGLRPSVTLISIALFGALASLGMMNGCVQTVIQSVVPKDLHGRVMSVNGMLMRAAAPIGYLVAGPLAEHVLQPLLSRPGFWTNTVGALIGTGPGRGSALYVLLVGLACGAAGAVGGIVLALRLRGQAPTSGAGAREAPQEQTRLGRPVETEMEA
jgi:MFS transporter, DHA3 family, macrolide efflux protein